MPIYDGANLFVANTDGFAEPFQGVVRTAVRHRAKRVTGVYRRPQAEILGRAMDEILADPDLYRVQHF